MIFNQRNYVIFFLINALLLFEVDQAISILLQGVPNNYRALLIKLAPGDTLLLEPGIYKNGLPIHNMNGKPGKPIVISGSRNRQPAIFWGRADHNTVSIVNSSYIELSNLVIDGRGFEVDGVKAEGHADWAHHITLENLLIYGHDANQQIVGINTKCPAWNWVIRKVIIFGAGTGMYLGNSDGTKPFISALIEYNVIANTLGYNLQIKHQVDRPNIIGIPTEGTTIIRHNVFCKQKKSSKGDMARPNVLVGHWPVDGPGTNDIYLIYGNFFYENPSEALFQGEGNIALYNNLFVNNEGTAINIRPHYDVPKMIYVFNNTVIAKDNGIVIKSKSKSYQQLVMGNAVFASVPIEAPEQFENKQDNYSAASDYLINPFLPLGKLNVHPKLGKLRKKQMKSDLFHFFKDWDTDFDGNERDWTFRGAYASEGENMGWIPKLGFKTMIKN